MLTLLEIIKKTTDFFDKKGIESARLNAELLVGHALGLKRMQLYIQFERLLAETEFEATWQPGAIAAYPRYDGICRAHAEGRWTGTNSPS